MAKLPRMAEKSSAFGSDNNARVEDYSHAGGFHGLRWLRISSTSSAKSGSRTGGFAGFFFVCFGQRDAFGDWTLSLTTLAEFTEGVRIESTARRPWL